MREGRLGYCHIYFLELALVWLVRIKARKASHHIDSYEIHYKAWIRSVFWQRLLSKLNVPRAILKAFSSRLDGVCSHSWWSVVSGLLCHGVMWIYWSFLACENTCFAPLCMVITRVLCVKHAATTLGYGYACPLQKFPNIPKSSGVWTFLPDLCKTAVSMVATLSHRAHYWIKKKSNTDIPISKSKVHAWASMLIWRQSKYGFLHAIAEKTRLNVATSVVSPWRRCAQIHQSPKLAHYRGTCSCFSFFFGSALPVRARTTFEISKHGLKLISADKYCCWTQAQQNYYESASSLGIYRERTKTCSTCWLLQVPPLS